MKLTLMGGINPVSEFDAYITYVMQRAEKASPGDVTVRFPRIWDWTKWDRDSISLNAAYTTEDFYIKTLAYYDNFRNSLYNERPHGIPADYDDRSMLGRITGGYNFNNNNKLEIAGTMKWDKHDGYDNITYVYTKSIKIEQYTYSIGAEYSTNPVKPFTVVLGAGYDMLLPTEYWTAYRGSEDFEKADKLNELVYQIGVFYDITPNHEIHTTFSKKTHFPTMYERFSARYDVTIPNPALKPEWANHYEVGYKGYYDERALLTTSIYFSDFRDKILEQLMRDPVTGQIITHSVNKDRWLYYGFELSGEVTVNEYLSAGLMFSYNKSDNRFDPTVQDAYYPEFNSYGQLGVTPTDYITIIPQFEYMGMRYVSSDTSDNTELPQYFLAHVNVKLDIFKHLFVEAGIENIFDKGYEIQQFYPQAGRIFTFAVGGVF
jgi:iron complex outermembrane receptor protein